MNDKLHDEIEYRVRTVAAYAYMRGKHGELIDPDFLNKEIEYGYNNVVRINWDTLAEKLKEL